jgi:hypothetical protein
MTLLASSRLHDRPAPTDPPSSDTVDLAVLVRSLAAQRALWVPKLKFTESRYWTRLPAPAGVDVWLLTWLPEQGTELHDHGESSAAFTVVAGILTELRADHQGRVSTVELGIGGVRTVEPGIVHDVNNNGELPAVSIHAYSPKLERMTYYELADAGPGRVLIPTRTVVGDEPEK